MVRARDATIPGYGLGVCLGGGHPLPLCMLTVLSSTHPRDFPSILDMLLYRVPCLRSEQETGLYCALASRTDI
jgi:hypothetical protein